MAYYFTSADLISSVKRRANIPDAQALITDAEILNFANEEMLMNLVPFVLSKHENYYTIREVVSVVASQLTYKIPYRAIGNKIIEVAYKDDGSTDLTALSRMSLDELTGGLSKGFNDTDRFHIEGESVVIKPYGSTITHDDIVFLYNIRPNMLVDASRVATISAINTTTGVITVDEVKDNFTSSSKIDFIQLNSPHRVIDYDITPTSLDTAAETFTFSTTDIPSTLAVGDKICLANETNLVNAPSALHPMLAEMVAARVLEAIGDVENLQAANDKLSKMEKRAEALIDNRVTGSPIKASARNFLLRGRRFNR